MNCEILLFEEYLNNVINTLPNLCNYQNCTNHKLEMISINEFSYTMIKILKF